MNINNNSKINFGYKLPNLKPLIAPSVPYFQRDVSLSKSMDQLVIKKVRIIPPPFNLQSVISLVKNPSVESFQTLEYKELPKFVKQILKFFKKPE